MNFSHGNIGRQFSSKWTENQFWKLIPFWRNLQITQLTILAKVAADMEAVGASESESTGSIICICPFLTGCPASITTKYSWNHVTTTYLNLSHLLRTILIVWKDFHAFTSFNGGLRGRLGGLFRSNNEICSGDTPVDELKIWKLLKIIKRYPI